MPAERLPHLFKKFSRIGGDEWEKKAGPGGGAGPGPRHLRGDSGDPRGRIWAESDGPGLGKRSPSPYRRWKRPRPFLLNSRYAPVGWDGRRTRILVEDDDPQTLRYVRDALTEVGYAEVATGDPEEALGIVAAGDVPVIFLSAYDREELIVRAFDMGAEDYVVKPFSPTELATRVRAALRRRAVSEQSEPYVLGDLTIDHAERRVTLGGRPVELMAIEYRCSPSFRLTPGGC